MKWIISILILNFLNLIYPQEFEIAPFITNPGNNFDFSIGDDYSNQYLIWINEFDSLYTVYIKKISPMISEDMIVSSDNNKKCNAQISHGKIAWQVLSKNGWRIYLKDFSNDSFGSSFLLSDSLSNNEQMTLSNYRIAWIINGKLVEKEIKPSISKLYIIDSSNCSNPNLDKYNHDFTDEAAIVYEKEIDKKTNIYYAKQEKYRSDDWVKSIINSDGENKCPKLPNDFLDFVLFQHKKDTVWNIAYGDIYSSYFSVTSNKSCNYENPIIFDYPLPTGSLRETTPFLLIFDSDSLKDNREIYAVPLISYSGDIDDTILNISNIEGSDYGPDVCIMNDSINSYVSIFWIHETKNKKDIWVAKTKFYQPHGDVNNNYQNRLSYFLSQNFPNPFNPTTTISFQLPLTSKVSLKVYDILGNEVATLVNEEKPAGSYEVEFSAGKLSSGIYFYILKAGENRFCKKMCLIK
jgi:hypothetical protein